MPSNNCEFQEEHYMQINGATIGGPESDEPVLKEGPFEALEVCGYRDDMFDVEMTKTKEFVQWVKTLFKSVQSCVMNNGFSTSYFAIERGTRQSDPLSAYLFILAIEVLLIRVRDSELVRGIPVTDKEIKFDAYADNGRFLLKDLQSLYTILDITEEFGTFSSLKLNLQKSEACWIGASRFNTNMPTNCIWVNLVNDKIRILGTYISYNKQLADQYSFVKPYSKKFVDDLNVI